MHPLPAELLLEVAQYLAPLDLRSFRLVNRQLAVIGSGPLFGTLTFHASWQSLERIQQVLRHDHFSDKVRSLIWDVRSYDIQVETLEEFKNYVWEPEENTTRGPWAEQGRASCIFRERLGLDNWAPLPKEYAKEVKELLQWQYDLLQNIRAEELAVMHRLASVDGDNCGQLWEILKRFHSLKSVAILHDNSKSELPWQERTTRLLLVPRGDGYHLQDYNPGVEAFCTLLDLCSKGFCSLPETLSLHWIHYNAFSKGTLRSPQDDQYWTQLGTCLSSVTSLDLKISNTELTPVSFHKIENFENCRSVLCQGLLKRFLRSARNLKRLTVHLGEGRMDNCLILPDGDDPASTIGHVFPLDQPWSFLEYLDIKRFDTSRADFAQLLLKHASTLRHVKVGHIRLFPNDSWPALLCDIQPSMRLKVADFHAYLWDTYDGWLDHDIDNGWALFEGLDVALSKWFVEGGMCPLTRENTV